MLLFDEPFGALDAQTRTRLRSEIRALLRQVNVPSIFITHDQEEALELGDRIAVMNEGRIEQIGTPLEIYNCAATEHVAKFLGRANSLTGTVRDGMVDLGIGMVGLRREQFQNGRQVKIIFRPEDVTLKRGPVRSDFESTFIGAIEEISFMGSYRKILLKLDNGHQILVTRPTSEGTFEDLQIGDQLLLQLSRFTVLSAE
jgi:putative spermidine/putrescine transport system ATP-binding protein